MPSGMVPQWTRVKELVAPPETISSFRPMVSSTRRAICTSWPRFSGCGLDGAVAPQVHAYACQLHMGQVPLHMDAHVQHLVLVPEPSRRVPQVRHDHGLGGQLPAGRRPPPGRPAWPARSPENSRTTGPRPPARFPWGSAAAYTAPAPRPGGSGRSAPGGCWPAGWPRSPGTYGPPPAGRCTP